jgi:hypothetical protein
MCSFRFFSIRTMLQRVFNKRQKRKSAHLERANVAIEMELFI